MSEEHAHMENAIKPGMEVEASGGDLGEQDISKPKVSKVVRDRDGNVTTLIVKKGFLFHKELDIPADRVQSVEDASQSEQSNGKVILDVDEKELDALAALGTEELADKQSLVDRVEQTLPTVEGVRELESKADLVQDGSKESLATEQKNGKSLLRVLGPGFLGGMAGNDSSAVTAYAIDGAQNGFGHLWLMLLATPMYQAVIYSCTQIAHVTKQGLAEILRNNYGRGVALLAVVILVVANVALIAADLVAIGSGIELLTGINWIWFVVPVALILWYLTVFSNFNVLKKVFIVMSLAFVVYFVTAIVARPDWGSVLYNTFVPHINLGFASISSAVALLGATVSPYNIFWQMQGEKEEARAGSDKQQMRLAAADAGIGVVSGNLIAYFIIISTATSLFTQHKSIATAADVALGLTQILGPSAKYLFVIGLIGSGLVAIPVLLAGTSYAVTGTFGLPAGLSKKPWQNEGFYLILSGALLVSLVMALVRIDPIRLMFWANILSGILAPILIVYLLIIGNNRKIMHGKHLGWLTNLGLVVTLIVMTAAAIMLFYGIATGQGA